MTIGEILKQFKENESAENIVPLVDSEELRNAIVAWKSVVVRYVNGMVSRDNAAEMSDAERWEWMWTQVEFDLPTFGVVAGVAGQKAGSVFTRLKGLRLIYPDGTINSFAAKYLQAIIMSKLPKPPKS